MTGKAQSVSSKPRYEVVEQLRRGPFWAIWDHERGIYLDSSRDRTVMDEVVQALEAWDARKIIERSAERPL